MPTTLPATTRQVLLDREGSDRATAYPMSPKVCRWGSGWLCTWLGRDRVNRWAVVDADSAGIAASGSIGPERRDNHCGAVVAIAADGDAHLLVGGHHNPFLHFRAKAGAGVPAWQDLGATVGEGSTYPSLVATDEGKLHLTYRCRGLLGEPYPYHVMYACWSADAGWTAPRALVRLANVEHSWTMHALTRSARGALHLVISATIPDAQGPGKTYGGVHIRSEDGGATWLDDAGATLAEPTGMAALPRIEGALDPRRADPKASPAGLPCGPANRYYHQMTLSNPLATRSGQLFVVLHEQLRGTAELRRREGAGWTVAATLPDPGEELRYLGFSVLAERADGTIEAVCTIGPTWNPVFGARGCHLQRLVFDADGRLLASGPAGASAPDQAGWLPSIERSEAGLLRAEPALLHTFGRNAAEGMAGANNFSQVATRVVLELP